jgi:hypothetical protein
MQRSLHVLDLPACLVVLVCLNVAILNSLFVDDLKVDGRMLYEILIHLKQSHIGRVQCDDIIGRVHHHAELLFHHLPLLEPRVAELIEVLLDFAV